MNLGLFGGTFDPIHNAHLFVAEAARVALELDRVVFLPTRGAHYRNPPVAAVDQRVAMIRLAIASNVHFALDEADLAPEATGYTADLLPRLRQAYANDRFTFIVGGDSLVDAPWHRFDAVVAGVDAFAVAPRAAGAPERPAAFIASLGNQQRAKFRLLDLPALSGSASMVRSELARGGSIRYLVPEAVHRYLRDCGLYRGQPMFPGVQQ
ncbi:MAG: nicotinate (nicotinamide) nucleotide adenylyltransferase [Candidatus Eremiobacteraeota bacterium]|nr:nicotinate (nicotinamide) nucleotide adenylyltransferase [Candidatus Eremiobacteraeota bacterium]MBC5804105.1 nicotinate (nicotinamide) nucleotide adenylyltransferase [Candidatus Eremiobacteraeota bacterium]MBC5820757.1 nicotinate (nicotinamide) nucleotide adenylyltransferase [Candidatus Eremiobacteraeota bacterium]